jgi:hypothetical protein
MYWRGAGLLMHRLVYCIGGCRWAVANNMPLGVFIAADTVATFAIEAMGRRGRRILMMMDQWEHLTLRSSRRSGAEGRRSSTQSEITSPLMGQRPTPP